MLSILGLGLRGSRSLTLEEADVISCADEVLLDTYTSVIAPGLVDDIESRLTVKVKLVDRKVLENSDLVFQKAMNSEVCLLVSGDPFMATTHNEIRYQCIKKGIPVRVFENASVINTVIGISGISPYKIGAPVSVPRITANFFPLSVYRKLLKNAQEKRHTVLLLDTADGNPMRVNEALQILEEMERRGSGGLITANSHICVASAVGTPAQLLVHGSLDEVRKRKIELVPSTVILLSDLDENETEYLDAFCERA